MNRDASNLLERMLVLRALPAFATLEEDALAGIARRAQEQVVEAGTVLQRAGHAVRRVWVVVDGRLRVEDGRRAVTRSEGRVGFGILRMVAEAPAPHSVVVDTRSRLLMLEQDSLRDLMDEDFTVLAHAAVLGKEIVETYLAVDVDYQAPEVLRPVPDQLQQERPLDLERLLAVRQVPAFGRSSSTALPAMQGFEEGRASAGQVLWTEGESGTAYLHLVSGTLRADGQKGGHLRTHHAALGACLLEALVHGGGGYRPRLPPGRLGEPRPARGRLETASFCLKRTAGGCCLLALRDDRATRAGHRDR